MYQEESFGGILTESFTRGEIVENIIVGIGFNINQVEFNHEIMQKATSLKKEFGGEFSKEKIFLKILEEFEKEYLAMIKSEF